MPRRAEHVAARGLIEVHRLSKSYRSGQGHVRALDSVSLRIEEGEFTAVLGPSGCGKSTLLAILGLLEKHDEGDYRLAGTTVSALGFSRSADLRNRHIGLVFQAFNLVANLTVLDNVLLPLRYSRTIPKSEHRPRALHYLERVGLAGRGGDHPHQLSGGQQQRVAIARAMVTDPSLILADEPTGNLDSARADEVMRLLEEFHREGATIVMVTHDRALAEYADRRIVMRDGRIIEGAHVE
ncbi:MAG: ABC transporter ATP-binding protein [Thermoanaerobaculia bacterium]